MDVREKLVELIKGGIRKGLRAKGDDRLDYSFGKIKIGAYQFQDRKRPCLCVEEGNSVTVCGSFHSTETANWFMDKVAECIGQKKRAHE